jgi:hypothetical protein
MNSLFLLNPEVAGQLGQNTILDNTFTPPAVKKLHYEFQGWLGDDLLESFPCFICTKEFADKLNEHNLSGYLLKDCEVSKSEIFIELYPERPLPIFYWLKIIGDINDDLSLSNNGSLLISENALNVFRQNNISHCSIEKYEIEPH